MDDGIYEISPVDNKGLILDIHSASNTNGARMIIYPPNQGNQVAGNNQKFVVVNASNPSNSDARTILPCHTLGKNMCVEWGSSSTTNNAELDALEKNKKHSYVQQHTFGSGTKWYANQQWVLVPTTYNNEKCYFIRSLGADKYVMDVSEGKTTTTGTYVIVFPRKDPNLTTTKNQKFVFKKTTLIEKTMAVPSSVGLSYTPMLENNATNTTLTLNSSNSRSVYPTWVCSGNDFQLRYRYKGRTTGTNNWSGFTSWKTLTGATTDDGWGDVMWSNLGLDTSDTASYNKWKSQTRKTTWGTSKIDLPANFNQANGYDQLQFEIEVRSFVRKTIGWQINTESSGTVSHSYEIPQTGLTTKATCYVKWQPTVTINSFVFMEDGLRIGYTSDFKRNNNKQIKIGVMKGAKGNVTTKEFTFTGKPYDGTITIPISRLAYIPDNGENITFTFYIQTEDGIARTQTFTRQVAYSSNHGLDVNAAFSLDQESGIVRAKPASDYPNKECHIIYKQDGETLISDCEFIGDSFVIIPPFDKDYTVIMSAESSDKVWGVRGWAGQKVHGEGHMFNFDDQFFRLFLQEAPYSGPDISYSADNQSYLLQGDRRESVYFGKGAQVTQSISGLVPIDQTQQLDGAKYPYPSCCSLEDFHKMRLAKYAVYRDLYGRRYDVAIVGTNESPHDENLFNVSISMKERM